MASLESRKKAYLAAKLALSKKAKDLVLLDMRKVCNFCDYFVVVTVTSGPQAQAIIDAVSIGFRDKGVVSRISRDSSEWMILDSFDVVVHVFSETSRDFYSLERLWQNAKPVKLPASYKNGPKKSRRRTRK
jgi:ribosome-associated protein